MCHFFIGQQYFFINDTLLTDLVIPEGITTINDLFRYDTCLISITIPNSVTSIEKYAFDGCSGLTSVVWNAKNYADFTNGDTPFYNTGYYNSFNLRSQITSFVFGDSVQHIPAYICDGMSNLTSITIPNNITSIGSSAFNGCNGLTSVQWNARNCADFTNDETPFYHKGSYYDSNGFDLRSQITSFTFGDSVQHIPAYMCNGMNKFTTVTIPNSVTSIGGSAFNGCNGITLISIPNSVTSIGANAFGNCDNLASVVWKTKRCTGWNDYQSSPFYSEHGNSITSFSFGKEVKSIPNYLCYEMKNLTSVVIPGSVDSIGEGAFRNCRALISVAMGKNVTYIGYRAFDGTYWLNNQRDGLIYMNTTLYGYMGEMPQGTEVIVREGTTRIGHHALAGCTGLTAITIPNSVTNIQDSAFYGCSSLDSIMIPNSVTTIGQYAFADCGNLTFATIGSNVARVGENAFGGCDSLTSVVWNAKHCGGWNAPFNDARENITSFTLGNEVEHIPAYLCNGMSRLDSITIPASVTSIGNDAFYGCNGLTSIIIPNNVVNIGMNAFSDCNNLTSVTWNATKCDGWSGYDSSPFYNAQNPITSFSFGNKVECIPAYLCYRMSRLDSITIPASVTGIGNDAFYGCYGLRKTNYTGDVASWYRIVFGNRQSNPIEYSHNFFLNNLLVTNLVVPEEITTINDAFSQDRYLVSVVIPNGVTTIGNSAFSHCSGLTSVTIPNSVTSIGKETFFCCSGLTSVTIPNSITSIGNSAFYSCSGLTSVTIPNSVTSIGSNAFYSCSGLTSITIPNSVTGIKSWAFSDCRGLTSVTCYATTPPRVESSTFSNVDVQSIPLYVSLESMPKYNSSNVWKDFLVLPISAMPADADEPVFAPEENKVTITWPAIEDAIAYTIEISNDSSLVCSLVFDAGGALKNMRYASPARHAPQRATHAETMGYGFRFVVDGLDYATIYTYTITATDIDDVVLTTYTGVFTTTGDNPPTDAEDVHFMQSQPVTRKVFRNGQVYIIRGDKTYTLTGEEVK